MRIISLSFFSLVLSLGFLGSLQSQIISPTDKGIATLNGALAAPTIDAVRNFLVKPRSFHLHILQDINNDGKLTCTANSAQRCIDNKTIGILPGVLHCTVLRAAVGGDAAVQGDNYLTNYKKIYPKTTLSDGDINNFRDNYLLCFQILPNIISSYAGVVYLNNPFPSQATMKIIVDQWNK